ncbi:hypothetical protein AB0L74_10485 [Streptomyces sp. NPDC052020]|uniref:hypothetical protein n=1 Tax=Streptomyces sp. NPDC052020 TaxID=3155677 RepID=UPI003442A6FD
MKLNEFIANAERALKEHGDIPVIIPDPGCGCCKSCTYDPAEGKVIFEVEAYDDEWKLADMPVAFVVQ